MSPDEQLQTGPTDPDLRPPGSQPRPDTGSVARHGLVWGALSLVVVLLVFVLLVLPKLVPDPAEEKPGVTAGREAVAPVQSSPAASESVNSRAEAEKALQDFLHLRARLELANAPAWGEPEWTRALDGAAEANDLFAQRKFSAANEALAESLALLQSIESGKGERLANALASGWQALQEDDSESAVGFFDMALAIEAGNESAHVGLERARARPALLELMADGEQARSDGELQRAKQAFKEATELDMAFEPASIALNEVSEQIIDLEFASAMSEALSAMDARRIKPAEAALNHAARLKPDDQDMKDTRHQLNQLRQEMWLADQREVGVASERKEDWSQAVRVYRDVQARVPQAAFAREGLARAQDRERLHRQLDHYLKDPSRVWSDKPRENAEKLLKAAGKPPAGEPVLADKIDRLRAIIVEAQTPQMVTLQSDGLTHVSIYHVGRLGQFTTRQLELRPGTYTVVGSRPGYRDVRQTLAVEPGSGQTTLDIRCEESI